MLQKTPLPPALSDVHRTLAALERQTDASFLNQVLNDPSVYPAVRGMIEGPIDATAAVVGTQNVLLAGSHGCILLVRHQPGFFEAHTQVLEDGRGAWTLLMVRAALHWMFTHTDAVEIATRCPRGNLPALALAKRIGGRFQFTNPCGWVKDGEPVPADIYSLSIGDWMASAPGLAERGHWFHEKLEAEYARLGAFDPEPHPDDDTHDRYVGAACEMMIGGQPHKAAAFYNKWAVMAGYAPVTILKDSPPTITIDIADAILIVRPNGDFWMAECRKPRRKDRH